MHYFLGLVTREDCICGNINPSYVLISTGALTTERSPWHVARIGLNHECDKRVLATSLLGNEIMIDYMSNYRTKVDTRAGCYKKFFPKGSLFWFECDRKGNRTGKAIYIKNVPDKRGRYNDDGWQNMRKKLLHTYSIPELLTKDERFYSNRDSGIAPLIMQYADDNVNYKEERQKFIQERCIYGKFKREYEKRNKHTVTRKH